MEQTKGVTIREIQVAAVIYITNVTYTFSKYLRYKSFESGLSFRRFDTPHVPR